jgi:hypothetical protein
MAKLIKNPRNLKDISERLWINASLVGVSKTGTLISIISRVIAIAKTPSLKNENLSNWKFNLDSLCFGACMFFLKISKLKNLKRNI